MTQPPSPAQTASRPRPCRHLKALGKHVIGAMILAGLGASAQAVSMAQVQPAPAGRFPGERADLLPASAGFVEGEFRMSGLAKRYQATGSMGADGKWSLKTVSADTPYATALIVRRPADPARFSGVVIVEWLNVSSGHSLDVDWAMSQDAFLRDGHAYIGVNAQRAGISGLKKVNATRYASLDIPSDDLSYDIFSQAALAARAQARQLLGGLNVRHVLATGHSQSAMRLTTYTNAVHPLDQVVDGVMLHGRANTGAKLAAVDKLPSSTVIRADVPTPVFQLQAEMDVAVQSATSKAIDSARIRYWEVAGASHSDQHLMERIYAISGRDIGLEPASCLRPANAMPFHRVENAAFRHLVNWVAQGVTPPLAPRIQRDWLGLIKRDMHGNALGGVRLPEIEAPVAKYGISNFTTGSLDFLDLFACVASGSTTPFSQSKLNQLYPDFGSYVRQYSAAAQRAIEAGHVLPEDQGAATRAVAERSGF